MIGEVATGCFSYKIRVRTVVSVVVTIALVSDLVVRRSDEIKCRYPVSDCRPRIQTCQVIVPFVLFLSLPLSVATLLLALLQETQYFPAYPWNIVLRQLQPTSQCTDYYHRCRSPSSNHTRMIHINASKSWFMRKSYELTIIGPE